MRLSASWEEPSEVTNRRADVVTFIVRPPDVSDRGGRIHRPGYQALRHRGPAGRAETPGRAVCDPARLRARRTDPPDDRRRRPRTRHDYTDRPGHRQDDQADEPARPRRRPARPGRA